MWPSPPVSPQSAAPPAQNTTRPLVVRRSDYASLIRPAGLILRDAAEPPAGRIGGLTRKSGTSDRSGDSLPGANMTETISLPTWVVAVAGALVLWAVLDRLLMPSTRWLFRRHAGRVIDELNTRLSLQIPLFQRTARQVLIDRLTSDPAVLEAVEAAGAAVREAVRGRAARGCALCAGDCPGVQRLRLFPPGLCPRPASAARALSRPPRLCRRRSAGPHRAQRERRVCDEPPQQCGLPPRRLPGRHARRLELCGRRMGTDLAPAVLD